MSAFRQLSHPNACPGDLVDDRVSLRDVDAIYGQRPGAGLVAAKPSHGDRHRGSCRDRRWGRAISMNSALTPGTLRPWKRG